MTGKSSPKPSGRRRVRVRKPPKGDVADQDAVPPEPVRKLRADGRSWDVENPTYDVGYGKPPLHSRFKPGQSGNPLGRPKIEKVDDLEEFDRVSQRKINVRQDGARKRMTQSEALDERLYTDALNGCKASARMILDKQHKLRTGRAAQFAELQLSEEEEQMIQQVLDNE